MWSMSVWVRRMALTLAPRCLAISITSSGSRLESMTTASWVLSSSTRYELVPNRRSAVTSTRTVTGSAGFARDGVDVLHAFELLHQARKLGQRVDLHGR